MKELFVLLVRKKMSVKKKFYTVTIDLVDSFNCEIQANSKSEALKKAHDIHNPQDGNTPHYSEARVVGIDGEPYYEEEE